MKYLFEKKIILIFIPSWDSNVAKIATLNDMKSLTIGIRNPFGMRTPNFQSIKPLNQYDFNPKISILKQEHVLCFKIWTLHK